MSPVFVGQDCKYARNFEALPVKEYLTQVLAKSYGAPDGSCDHLWRYTMLSYGQWRREPGRAPGQHNSSPPPPQRRSQVSLAGGADRIPGGGDKPQYL